ncbi:hypothetical protein OG786_00960 [Streptomyces sp. NBC_00101]|uniref:hypothetical protein n=1 Tax=Streptomyces sp. NBC_00101 TaxID=2975651 RepID=UPI00324AC58D
MPPRRGKVFAVVLADAYSEVRTDRSTVSVDSTSCRPYRHAAGARPAAAAPAGK